MNVATWNLGCATAINPFEFDGDYGNEINQIREAIFRAFLTDDEIDELLDKDLQLDKLIGHDLSILCNTKQLTLSSMDDLDSELSKLQYDHDGTHSVGLQAPITHELLDNYYHYHTYLINLALSASSLSEINYVKDVFDRIFNSSDKYTTFASRMKSYDVLFVQEGCSQLVAALTDYECVQQGTTQIYLRKETWSVLQSDESGSTDTLCCNKNKKICATFARHRSTGQKWLLASAHGKSTDHKNAIEIIQDISQFAQTAGAVNVMIGIDANTKNISEIGEFLVASKEAGFQCSKDDRSTTKKIRKISVQKSKIDKLVETCEDFVLWKSQVSMNVVSDETITTSGQPSTQQLLPSKDNFSDHLGVSISFEHCL